MLAGLDDCAAQQAILRADCAIALSRLFRLAAPRSRNHWKRTIEKQPIEQVKRLDEKIKNSSNMCVLLSTVLRSPQLMPQRLVSARVNGLAGCHG